MALELVTKGASRTLRDLLNRLLTRTGVVQTLTDAATIAMNVANGANAKVTLTTSRIMGAPTNANAGDSGVIRFIQSGTGSCVITWNAAWRHAGGTDTVLSTAANAIDDLQWWTPDGTSFVVLSACKAVDV